MPSFANQSAFDDQNSYRQAIGENLDPNAAFKDPSGNILFRVQTGGMISPVKAELTQGTTLFRFAAGSAGGPGAMKGGWWVAKPEFDRIVRFAQVHEISDPLAARILLGVPPEWSDMGVLIRVRVIDPLLAWRGLANSVVVPYPGGGPQVRMLHQNANAERRTHQLFIPGLSRPGLPKSPFAFESEWRFTAAEAKRGWLYV